VTIRLAAIQARSLPGQIQANLDHGAGLVEQAAAQGASMVVLPELFSCGYVPNRAVWEAAEARAGQTDGWLAATARRLGIYLGVGVAEADGTDFFNVFTLAAPDGRIAGRAYKANAEASILRRGRSAHLFDTGAGRIGIGICADNQFAATLRLMGEQRADLILMPHAWPTPARAAGLVSQADVAAQQQRMTELPVLYARALGVPVVFVNQVGPLLPIGGILGHLMDPRIWRLRGQSRIVDSDGSVLGQLAEEEAVGHELSHRVRPAPRAGPDGHRGDRRCGPVPAVLGHVSGGRWPGTGDL
jgi:N-carbamoylputrescine amidase